MILCGKDKVIKIGDKWYIERYSTKEEREEFKKWFNENHVKVTRLKESEDN